MKQEDSDSLAGAGQEMVYRNIMNPMAQQKLEYRWRRDLL